MVNKAQQKKTESHEKQMCLKDDIQIHLFAARYHLGNPYKHSISQQTWVSLCDIQPRYLKIYDLFKQRVWSRQDKVTWKAWIDKTSESKLW